MRIWCRNAKFSYKTQFWVCFRRQSEDEHVSKKWLMPKLSGRSVQIYFILTICFGWTMNSRCSNIWEALLRNKCDMFYGGPLPKWPSIIIKIIFIYHIDCWPWLTWRATCECRVSGWSKLDHLGDFLKDRHFRILIFSWFWLNDESELNTHDGNACWCISTEYNTFEVVQIDLKTKLHSKHCILPIYCLWFE